MSGREWEMRVQQYEDEDEDDEPSLWTRLRSLLLHLSLQLYHRMMKLREQLQKGVRMLGDAADKVRPQEASFLQVQQQRVQTCATHTCTGRFITGCWTRPLRGPNIILSFSLVLVGSTSGFISFLCLRLCQSQES